AYRHETADAGFQAASQGKPSDALPADSIPADFHRQRRNIPQTPLRAVKCADFSSALGPPETPPPPIRSQTPWRPSGAPRCAREAHPRATSSRAAGEAFAPDSHGPVQREVGQTPSSSPRDTQANLPV